MLTEPTIPQASTRVSSPTETSAAAPSFSSRLSCHHLLALVSLLLEQTLRDTHPGGLASDGLLSVPQAPPPHVCSYPEATPASYCFPLSLCWGGGAGAFWVSLHPPLVCRPSHPLGEPGLLLLTTTLASPCLLRSCTPHLVHPPHQLPFSPLADPTLGPSPQLPNSVLPP